MWPNLENKTKVLPPKMLQAFTVVSDPTIKFRFKMTFNVSLLKKNIKFHYIFELEPLEFSFFLLNLV